MRQFLGFRLEAPLAAMGELTVGERRYGGDRPAKSAIVGLLAAALGILRSEDERLCALAEGYGLAVRMDRLGTFLEDYHTVQTSPAGRGRRPSTRREQLAAGGLETLVSCREYRCDVCATVMLWARQGAPETLAGLKAALHRPRFVLWFGRKSCPLSRPLAPHILEAHTLVEAFARFDEHEEAASLRLPRRLAQRRNAKRQDGRPIYADTDCREWIGDGLRIAQRAMRRDQPGSRRTWQYGLRDELVLQPVAAERPVTAER